ncbi:FkbM family methyltransferase [Salinibacter ruber]|uniref:FkbM family methyltransferase n=1 Tax=Salinibacter ruber TaxID=146919 RepID=A0A9X3A9A0_9BACT|nr:FkbM family methyltransferase [Salinibacter ruber]MCS4122728.1 FkbM family methyltransferase [Salinibacter ruber]
MTRLLDSTPPDWLFQRSIVEWTINDRLRTQLPYLYQLFSHYTQLFFKVSPSSPTLRGGKYVLQLLNRLNAVSGNRYVEIDTGTYEVIVDITDPRFLKVVSELSFPDETQFLSELLDEGDTFVDVGANQGTYSIVASHLVGEHGTVLAFEPQASLSEAVRRSLEKAPANYEVFTMALGDRDGEVDIHVPSSYSGRAGIIEAYSGKRTHDTKQVPIRRADTVLESRESKGNWVVKVDVEGAELAFLRGAQTFLSSVTPSLIIEMNPHSMRDANITEDKFIKEIRGLGFNFFQHTKRGEAKKDIEKLDLSGDKKKDLILN